MAFGEDAVGDEHRAQHSRPRRPSCQSRGGAIPGQSARFIAGGAQMTLHQVTAACRESIRNQQGRRDDRIDVPGGGGEIAAGTSVWVTAFQFRSRSIGDEHRRPAVFEVEMRSASD
jgi:hypothetical protein